MFSKKKIVKLSFSCIQWSKIYVDNSTNIYQKTNYLFTKHWLNIQTVLDTLSKTEDSNKNKSKVFFHRNLLRRLAIGWRIDRRRRRRQT